MIADAGSVSSMQRRSWWVGVAVAMQIVVAASLLMIGTGESTTRAPVVVVGPSVVAPLVAERANGLPNRPFDAWAEESWQQAQEALADGRAVAVLELDLAANQDTVTLAGGNGERLDRVLAGEIRAVEATFGRTIAVEAGAKPDQDRRLAYILVAATIASGFVASLVSWGIRGPTDTDRSSLAARIRRHTAISLIVGAGAGLVGGVGWLILGGLLCLVAAMVTNAAMALMDLPGLVLASTVFVVAAAPLATFDHPLLLQAPWAMVTPYLPHGAGLQIAQSLAVGGAGEMRTWLVLGGYLVVPVVAMIAARRKRPIRPA